MVELLALTLLIVWCALLIQTVVNLLVFRSLPVATGSPRARVSIVIPARNEERDIGKTIDRALAQEYPDFEVVVVNDGSTDGTEDEIDRRRNHPKLRAVNAPPLPNGWLGKPHALWTGAKASAGEWLLFMDADVSLDPRTLRDAVDACDKNHWDQLALLPNFERKGFWEQLLMPLIPTVGLVYVPIFLAFLPFVPVAVGGGAFALVRRRAYESVGGHEAIKASVVDDIRLAIELKKAGLACAARLAIDRVSLRMYRGREEITRGFEKNAHAGFGRSRLRPLVAVPASLFIIMGPFLWPVAAVLAPERAFESPLSYLGSSLALLAVSRSLAHLRLRFPLWPIALSPLATLIFMKVTWRSLRSVHGRGVVQWRGREYPYGDTEF